MAALKSLSHTHHALLEYMMANPTVALGDVAKHFKYTQGWLSQIVHSDAFQAMLKERTDLSFHETVLPLREKIQNIAHAALDQLSKDLPNTDARTVAQVADSMLDRLGFGAKPIQGPGGVTNIQNNVYLNSNAAEVQRAREAMLAKTSALGAVNAPIPGALSGASSPALGAPDPSSEISSTDGADYPTKERIEVRADGSLQVIE